MKQIIENILQRLEGECPALAYIGKDCGQLYAEEIPTQWPCALVDVREGNYRTTRDGVQTTEACLSITLADRGADRTSEDAPLRLFDALAQVSDALQGWAPTPHSSPLNRQQLKRRVLKHTDYEVYRMEFITRYNEKF